MRLLTNLETETQKLLQIILIGQPELRELLDRVELRQLAQRITGRYHLDPLSDDESAAYVRHRLRVAGATREILSNGALREVQRLSGGVPRLINIISDRALLGAFTEDRHAGERQRRAARRGRSVRQAHPATLVAVGRRLGRRRTRRGERSTSPAATAGEPARRAGGHPAAPPPAPAPAPPPPDLDQLLGQYVGETDPDNAFNKLFALWGNAMSRARSIPAARRFRRGWSA